MKLLIENDTEDVPPQDVHQLMSRVRGNLAGAGLQEKLIGQRTAT